MDLHGWSGWFGWLILPLGITAAGCQRTILSVDDAVWLKGRQTRFVAYVEREPLLGVRDGIENAEVLFSVGGREAGAGKTDGEGRSAITCRLDAREPSRFEAHATVGGQRLHAEGTIHHWRDDRVIIAVDIDGTLARTEYDDLILEEKDEASRPLPGAPETLQALAADFHIAYATARPRFLLNKTRRWLAEFGFPPGPVITSPRLRDQVYHGRYKRRLIARLQRDWPNLLIGIGDTEADAHAYGANGMLTLVIDQHEEDAFGSHAVVFRRWDELSQFFAANRAVLTDVDKVKEVAQGDRIIQRLVLPWRERDD